MKKKIAFFANGWSENIIQYYLDGMIQSFPANTVDVFMFLGHARYIDNEARKICEASIYDLPNLNDFDAAIIFGSSLNFEDIREHVYSFCLESNIPVISVGLSHEGCINITSDNRIGMQNLCNHLINRHKVKTALYIAGTKDHPDSMLRQSVLSDAMHDAGLEFSEENVFYSNWEPLKVVGYLQDKYNNPDDLPDAILCANDQLAEATINVLFEKEILVPKDVIVTGFDRNPEGQIFYPSLSTVSQNHNLMGVETAKILIDLFKSGADFTIKNDNIVVPSVFVPSESCGCDNFGIAGEYSPRDIFLRNMPRERELGHSRVMRLHEMEWAVSRSEKYDELPGMLRQILYSSNRGEGDSFHVLINPAFKEFEYYEYDSSESVFPAVMDVIVSKEDGIPYMDNTFKTQNLIPGYRGAGINHVYTFLTVFPQECPYGYIVMRDNLNYLNETIFREFAESFSRSLESCQKNIQLSILNEKLSELMQKDALTSVKNRIAYEKYIKQLDEQIENGKAHDFAVVMFDANNLKSINDEYGHDMGDLYLKNSCKLICDTFKHSPIFRIGGDEFIAILIEEDMKTRSDLMRSMKKQMETLKSSKNNPWEKVSIASGIAEYNKESDHTIKDIIKRADQLMYENKKQMKRR